MKRSIVENLRQRRILAASGTWLQSGKPLLQHHDDSFWITLFSGIIIAVIICYIGSVLQSSYGEKNAVNISNTVALIIACIIWFKPYLLVLVRSITLFERPQWHLMKTFPIGVRFAAAFMAGFCLVTEFENYYTAGILYLKREMLPWLGRHLLPWLQTFGDEKLPRSNTMNLSTPDYFLSWAIVALVIFGLTELLALKPGRYHKQKKQYQKIGFSIWLGESTGLFAKRGHENSLQPHQQISLHLPQACQNILIMGGIGSGKTASMITPILIQLLDQQCGGLIFDIKGDFHTTVAQAAEMTQRTYINIGIGQVETNLIGNLSPEIAASMLKSAFLLGSNRSESFWIDTATELCRNALGVLQFFREYYTLKGLYNYIFDTDFKNEIRRKAAELIDESQDLSLQDKNFLLSYWQYENTIFLSFDEKVISGVKATCAQVLSPFNHPSFVTAFCAVEAKEIAFHNMLDGQIFLVTLPLAQWGLGAKVIYTLLKLRFFNLMQQRVLHPEWNQVNPVFFLCDEYQEIISANKDGLSDLNFWDKARSSKTIGIVSAQSVSSFYAAIGDRDLALAVLQNFRQKLCFKTEDETTINLFQSLTGHADVMKFSTSKASHREGLLSYEKSNTVTSTHSIEKQAVIDSQFFRKLQLGNVIAILSIGDGISADDLLVTMPVILD